MNRWFLALWAIGVASGLAAQTPAVSNTETAGYEVPNPETAQPSSPHAEGAGPDGKLRVSITVQQGMPLYAVSYNGKCMLRESPLGFVADAGDFSRNLTLAAQRARTLDEHYTLRTIKQSEVHYRANELTVTFANAAGQTFDAVFRISNNDVAFRYEIPRLGGTGCLVIREEATGFRFPAATTTFLTPQSDPMIGWMRTKPSYEEIYKADAPLGERSQYGHGFTFPGLFRIGDNGWVLLSETGVDGKYCASRLSDASSDGLYKIEFPMPGENNGNGTPEPGIALPGHTPWRTITAGGSLAPIVETTVPWDVVTPAYESAHDYRYGRGTWSWILWQDGSINYEDQVKYVDLAAAMGYEYLLVDNWWDRAIGRERIKELIDYARSKGVEVFLWYSSSGSWNDIRQSPVNCMDDPIVRKREMRWLRSLGVKGIKVDFFGGDKQETMRLYEAILSDADDNALMVIFHGCTIPRGWERMYPNYVGSEAVLASENLIFGQEFNDNEAFNACLHPFVRNTIGSMEFGGVVLNKRLHRSNNDGCTRRTTDIFQLATAILFQNPIQNFALAPNNLDDAPALTIDFMKGVPTTWDETRLIDGYPGQYCVVARRHGQTWYIAGVNARKEPLTLKLALPMLAKGDRVVYYTDDVKRRPQASKQTVDTPMEVEVTILPDGGMILVR